MSLVSAYESRPNLTTKFNEDGSIATTSSSTYTLFDLEKKVIDALDDFNQKYAIYLRCSEGIYDINEVNYNIKYEGKSGCPADSSNKDANATTVQTAYAILKTRIYALNNALTNISGTSGGITPEEYNSRYSGILAKHADIIKLREELDSKMMDIEAVDNLDKRHKNPRVQDVFTYHDTTIYSSLMLTVLATSLLYYAFVKMK